MNAKKLVTKLLSEAGIIINGDTPWDIHINDDRFYQRVLTDLGLVGSYMEDWHNLGPDYDKTLLAWYQNFNKAWPKLKDKYGDRFYRMWRYYLLSSAGGFRARSRQLWQIVLTKPGREQPVCSFS